jgi:hypothetical protein
MDSKIIREIKSNLEYMSGVERKIADIILSDAKKFTALSLQELSIIAGVSQGSIINFANKFAGGGFPALKIAIARCVATETEETEGEQFRKCKTCGKIEEKQLPKLVHVHDNDSEIIKEPTCISTGILKAVCKKCGVVQELEINIDKAGHKYGEWEEISEKMNETTGTKKRVCTLCSYVDEQVHNHEFNEWKTIVQSTCLQTGKIESTCEQCSYKTTEVTPISDHEFSEWDVYKIPTCLADGNAKRACIYCNLVEDVVLPQSDDAHVYGEWKVLVKETLTTTGL